MSHAETEVDLAQQIKKIAEHLGFLEKKIDTLIEQANNRGNSADANRFPPRREFSGGRPDFKRPYRPNGQRPGGYSGPSSHSGGHSSGHSSGPSNGPANRYGTRTQTYGRRPGGQGGYPSKFNKKPARD